MAAEVRLNIVLVLSLRLQHVQANSLTQHGAARKMRKVALR